MKNLFLLVILSSAFAACTKEQNRQLLGAYFKFKADGTDVNISDGTGLNANTFDCIIKGDTALYIDVEKQVTRAGFYIKAFPLKDTTYVLDSLKIGYYTDPLENKKYTTSNRYKGILTIKRGTFQAKDMLNTLEGTFSYQVEDTSTHRTHIITEGSFLMERDDQ